MDIQRTRIKFCGITSVRDAESAVAAGADAIGLNFYSGSSRFISLEQAADIADAVPAFITLTALFVDPEPELVRETLNSIRVDLLQFHGDEPPEFCRSFGRPYMKVLKVAEKSSPGELAGQCRLFADASALLIDTWHPSLVGGSGKTFDWGVLNHSEMSGLETSLVLAGGLNPENVADAIVAVNPYAVDVSSGIEKDAGSKSTALMQQFVRAAGEADQKRLKAKLSGK